MMGISTFWQEGYSVCEQEGYSVHEQEISRKMARKKWSNCMAISVTQLKLIRFIPSEFREISNVLQQGMQKKGSKSTVGAKNEVERIQGEN